MSFRSDRDQIALEEREAAKTLEQRQIEAGAWNLKRQDVERVVGCVRHVAQPGYACSKFGGSFFVCKPRRIAAAYKLAGVEQP